MTQAAAYDRILRRRKFISFLYHLGTRDKAKTPSRVVLRPRGHAWCAGDCAGGGPGVSSYELRAKGRVLPLVETRPLRLLECEFPDAAGRCFGCAKNALISQLGGDPSDVVLPCKKQIARSSQLVLIIIPHVFAYFDGRCAAVVCPQRFN